MSTISTFRSGNEPMIIWWAILAPGSPGGTPGTAASAFVNSGAKCWSSSSSRLWFHASSILRTTSLFASDIGRPPCEKSRRTPLRRASMAEPLPDRRTEAPEIDSVAASGLRGHPSESEVDPVAAHRDTLLLEKRSLAPSLREAAVGPHDSMPRHVLARGREHLTDMSRRMRVDVAIRPDKALGDGLHPPDDRAITRDHVWLRIGRVRVSRPGQFPARS